MVRLREAWEQRRALDPSGSVPEEQPVSAACALAQYCSHVITKMNANLGFGPHMPGMGRQQVTPHESNIHFKRLADALLQAIQRDFDKADQGFGGVRHPRHPAAQPRVRGPPLTSASIAQRRWPRAAPQGPTPLTASQIIHISQLHLKGVVLYQQELGNALAVANREGEDARREERMQIGRAHV